MNPSWPAENWGLEEFISLCDADKSQKFLLPLATHIRGHREIYESREEFFIKNCEEI